MDLADILFLSVLQGITEPLPVSSSGHLVVAAEALRRDGRALPDSVALVIFLHVASALAFLIYFRRTVASLFVRPLPRGAWLNVIAACAPVGVIGVLIKLMHWDEALETVPVTAVGFLLSAAIVGTVSRLGRNELAYGEITPGIAFRIGLAQCIGILPGVSRSGITIAAGLAQHVKGPDAARFSFLIALPVIFGAGLVDALKSFGSTSQNTGVSVWTDWKMWIGFAVCFAVTYGALVLLMRLLERRRFGIFAWYLIGASAVTFGVWATA